MQDTDFNRRGEALLKRADELDELDLTLFMPCRDEEGNVSRALHELVETLKLYPFSYEIIVVDDGSKDGSVGEIRQFMAEHPDVNIVLKQNTRSLGVSYNLTDAAVLGRGRHFQFISSAFQNRRDSLTNVFNELGNADLVVTYIDPDRRPGLRRWLSRQYTGLVNLVSGYNLPHYHGTPLYRRIDVVRWHSYRTVGFYADLITRLLDEGISYIVVPTPVHEREKGKSRALRIRNLISLAIGFSDMILRRFSKDRIPPRRLEPLGKPNPGVGQRETEVRGPQQTATK
ncbi:MAG TPA: glycosyltransferase [Xanthobacteraceae bacterium]|jgi:glycosyltransferase involved in cell wall biosynthesis|nr:glycosyltransferase [Xanthobacteraceae bacterium]